MTETPSAATLDWLLDPAEPAVRYLALRDLVQRPADDAELREARRVAYREGPIAAILAEMHPDGSWLKPGPGYTPKYRSTVWAVLLLAQLGAAIGEDERIAQACEHLLTHALQAGGQFSASSAPSGTADCLQGNLCWALLTLGCDPARLESAINWTARSVTGEGIAPRSDHNAALRYYAGKCGPGFACGANNGLPCAWGAVKVMLALGAWPAAQRSPLIERAIAQGIDFLFSVDPATAAYPSGYHDAPSSNWWKFGFPLFYVSDILQIAEALCALGLAHDERLAGTLALIRRKADADGRWPLEYHYNGKTWLDVGARKQPNRWVTLRALRVLQQAG